MDFDLLYKVLLVGDAGVGKSALLTQHVDSVFDPSYTSTIGVDFKVCHAEANNGKVVKLQLWDTAGQERFRTITASYYRSAGCVLLVYAVDNRESFEHVQQWRNEIARYATNPLIILVANKIDSDRRCVTTEEGRQLAREYDWPYYEVSAKRKATVGPFFNALVEHLVEDAEPHQPPLNLNIDTPAPTRVCRC